MPRLPTCQHREQTPRRNVYRCLHPVFEERLKVTPSQCRGCTVQQLSSEEAERVLAESTTQSPPPLVRRLWNLAGALAMFVSDGCRTVDSTEYERRLSICDGCDRRVGNSCLECGCALSIKARGRAFDCPLSRWKLLPQNANGSSPNDVTDNSAVTSKT